MTNWVNERSLFLRCVRIALSMVFRQPPWNLLRIQRVRMCKARPSVGENRPLREMSSSMDALAVFHQLTRVWTTHRSVKLASDGYSASFEMPQLGRDRQVANSLGKRRTNDYFRSITNQLEDRQVSAGHRTRFRRTILQARQSAVAGKPNRHTLSNRSSRTDATN